MVSQPLEIRLWLPVPQPHSDGNVLRCLSRRAPASIVALNINVDIGTATKFGRGRGGGKRSDAAVTRQPAFLRISFGNYGFFVLIQV